MNCCYKVQSVLEEDQESILCCQIKGVHLTVYHQPFT